jgi:O-methyltransferase
VSAGFAARRIVQTALRGLGYELVRSRPGASKRLYQPLTPAARYNPWFADAAFQTAYKRVRPHTYVDIYRCYELWGLVAQCGRLGGAVLEVGTWRGGSGALLAMAARHFGIATTVYLCDTFRGIVKAGARDPYFRDGDVGDCSQAQVEALLYGELSLHNARVLAGVFPDESGPAISDERFALCHIDVDVYRSAAEALAWVWPRLCVGGVVVYDDYGHEACAGVTAHVEEQRGRGDGLLVYNLNGHALLIKLQG